MGALFVAGSSQYLSNAASALSSTVYPTTIGLWVLVASTGTERVIWNCNNSGSGANFCVVSATAAGAFLCEANDTTDKDATTGTVAANRWFYLVVRYVSSTNRRISVLDPSGTASHAQNTTSCALAGVNRMNIGAFQSNGAAGTFFDGHIAEFFVCNADIQLDGAQLQDATLRQLAYLGPFSIPNVAASLLEYRSFYSTQGQDTNNAVEVYCPGRAPQAWVNNAGVKVGLHPPLFPEYVRPADTRRILVI